jgi:hypothetical protein
MRYVSDTPVAQASALCDRIMQIERWGERAFFGLSLLALLAWWQALGLPKTNPGYGWSAELAISMTLIAAALCVLGTASWLGAIGRSLRLALLAQRIRAEERAR